MAYLEIVLLVVGIALVIHGYRRDNRKLLLVAAIALLLSGSLESFVTGFVEGLKDARLRVH